MNNKFLSISLLLATSFVSGSYCMEGQNEPEITAQIQQQQINSDKQEAISFNDIATLEDAIRFILENLDNSGSLVFSEKKDDKTSYQQAVRDIFSKEGNKEEGAAKYFLDEIKTNSLLANEKVMNFLQNCSEVDKQSKLTNKFNKFVAGAKSDKAFAGYASVAGAGTVWMLRDGIWSCVKSTGNKIKDAANWTIKKALLKNDGKELSKVKATGIFIGGSAVVGVYVYNKKTAGSIAKIYNNLVDKLSKPLAGYYNNSVRAQNIVGTVSGAKDSAKNFFIGKDDNRNYKNTYISIIALGAGVAIVKLASKYFEKGQESSANKLLLAFGDTADNLDSVKMNQDAINLQAKMIAAIASADVKKLMAIKNDCNEMLTPEQQFLLEEAITEIQNN